MRTLLFGALAGLLLSLLRAPLGLDLLQIPAVDGHTALGVRALALFVIGGGVLASVHSALTTRLLFGVLLGYAGHGLLLGASWAPGSRLGLALTALAGLALLVWIARGLREDPQPAQEAPAPAAGFGEMLGHALAGAGLAVGLELVARHLRLHGGQLSADDSVFGSVLLALLLVGAAAFGWIARRPAWRSFAPGVLLAAAGASLYLSLHSLARLTETGGLRAYVHSFGLDLAGHGTPAYDALLAASFFVAPAFVIGAALCALEGRKRIFALLLGAAAGLCFVPELFETAADTASSEKHTFAAQFITIASITAVLGGACALLCLPGKPSLRRWLAISLALLCGLPAATIEVAQQSVLAPWRRQPTLPYLYFDTPAGLLTVEGPMQPPGSSPLLNKMVTLERRVLVPGPESTRGDLARIDLALGQLSKEAAERKDKRALVVGQLTPLIARRLSDAGFAEIDRSAAWWAGMERVERELFDTLAPPAGQRLAPAAARERIAAGQYDFVLVPQSSGDVAHLARLDVPARSLLVVWIDAGCPAAASDLGEEVLICAQGMDQPSIARVVHGRGSPADEPLGPQFLQSGAPARSPLPLCWIAQREDLRVDAARARLFERFAAAARGTPEEPLVRGLSAVYSAQVSSSPFDSEAERFELPQEALVLLRDAALARKPNGFVTQLWEWTALVLAQKRWIPQLYEHVEPLAKAWAPWPALERMLARADGESLEFENARKRLETLRETGQARDPGYWIELGNTEEQLEHSAQAIACWRKSCELAPGHPIATRKLAMALVRAGDPEGKQLVERILKANPKDIELQTFAGDGPYPPPKKGYEPPGGH
jgi:tetratricopeptide (TPR) repeat protein